MPFLSRISTSGKIETSGIEPLISVTLGRARDYFTKSAKIMCWVKLRQQTSEQIWTILSTLARRLSQYHVNFDNNLKKEIRQIRLAIFSKDCISRSYITSCPLNPYHNRTLPLIDSSYLTKEAWQNSCMYTWKRKISTFRARLSCQCPIFLI